MSLRLCEPRTQDFHQEGCNDLEMRSDTGATVQMLEVEVCSGQGLWDGEMAELCRAHAVEGCRRESTSARDAEEEPGQGDLIGGAIQPPSAVLEDRKEAFWTEDEGGIGTSIIHHLVMTFKISFNISELHSCL